MVYTGAVMLNSSQLASLRMFKIVFSTMPSTRLPNSGKLQNIVQNITMPGFAYIILCQIMHNVAI